MAEAVTPYRAAYEQTSETLIRLNGLARAAYDLGMNHPELGSRTQPATRS